jgi:hypothetical protein
MDPTMRLLPKSGEAGRSLEIEQVSDASAIGGTETSQGDVHVLPIQQQASPVMFAAHRVMSVPYRDQLGDGAQKVDVPTPYVRAALMSPHPSGHATRTEAVHRLEQNHPAD